MNRLQLAHLNCRSLLTHFDLFRDYVCSLEHDILALTETCLRSDVADGVVNIPGYNFIRLDRPTHGGGVAMYIRDSLRFKVLDHGAILEYIEHLWISVEFDGVFAAVGVVYRPCGSLLGSFLSFFEELYPDIFLNHDECFCLGDFNIDLLVNTTSSLLYRSAMEGMGLRQVINSPTRVTGTSSTLIDHIFTADSSLIVRTEVVDLHGVSDHFLICASVNIDINVGEVSPTVSRNLSGIMYEAFFQDLQDIPWHTMYSFPSIDDKVNFFNYVLLALFDAHAPLRQYSSDKSSAPWITPTIRHMKTLRDRARRRFERTQNPATYEYYKSLRNLVNSSTRAEKRAYLESYTAGNQNDSRALWKGLNRLGVHSKTRKCLPPNLRNPDMINNFLTSNIIDAGPPSDELLHFYSHSVRDGITSEFCFSLVEPDDILKIIVSIKSNAVGSDSLSIAMIKLCCPFILPMLAHLINTCLLEGVFPSAWREAHVIPIPKTKICRELRDIRPISILSPLAKILEKIIDRQIRDHLSSFDILPSTQSGFRPLFGCATALSSIVDDIIGSRDLGLNVALVLIDFSKAFDTLDHNLLLSILHYCGFSEIAICFFENYLIGRCQRVCVSGVLSQSRLLVRGVPQGSILGPLLYTMYTSFIYNSLDACAFHLYADDSQLYHCFRTDEAYAAERRINSDLESLRRVASEHCLVINPAKSSLLLFCSRNDRNLLESSLRICIGDTVLQFSHEVKNLGVVLDTDLRFRNHVSGLLQKAYSSLKSIYLHRHYLSTSVRKRLCDALVLSHLNHCDVVYGPGIDSTDALRIQRLQSSCLRFIFGIPRRQRISHTLRLVRWLNMVDRRFLHISCFIHKVVIFKTPPYLSRRISYRTDVHNLNLRHRGLISIPRHSSALFKRSFSYLVPSIYNGIPAGFTSLSPLSFKIKLRTHLLQLADLV